MRPDFDLVGYLLTLPDDLSPVAWELHELRWMLSALCAEVGTQAWFSEQGENTHPAQRICAACPVRYDCLVYGLRNREEYGVFGGLTANERDIVLARHKQMRRGTLPQPVAAALAAALDDDQAVAA
jgi:hypothetical protein